MRVLVTGAAGFVGAATTHQLLSRGDDVVGIDNLNAYYDPKLKKTLPYYDRFPLTIMVDEAPGGFYGINFHYLQPGARVAFLRQLQRFATDKNYDKNTRYNIGELSGRYFKKTIKRYLFSQVRTSFLNITADEMAIAIFLGRKKRRAQEEQDTFLYTPPPDRPLPAENTSTNNLTGCL